LTKKSDNPAYEKLNPRQKQFVVAYFDNGFNATAAYKAAGYEEKCAPEAASRLLRDVKVQAAISEQLDTMGVTPERIKTALAEIAFDGDLSQFEDFLTGSKLTTLRDEEGVNTKLVKSAGVSITDKGTVRKLELHDRLSALKELARIVGIVTEKHEIKAELPGITPELLEEIARHKGGPKE